MHWSDKEQGSQSISVPWEFSQQIPSMSVKSLRNRPQNLQDVYVSEHNILQLLEKMRHLHTHGLDNCLRAGDVTQQQSTCLARMRPWVPAPASQMEEVLVLCCVMKRKAKAGEQAITFVNFFFLNTCICIKYLWKSVT